MTRGDIEKMKEALDKLEDSMQVSTLHIEQDEHGNWPEYNPAWRAKMIAVHQSGIDGSWPSYYNRLGANTKVVIRGMSFTPAAMKANRAEWAAIDARKALQAGGARLPTRCTPNPLAQRERRDALARGVQVPVDPERLDKFS
jgi:hypothetical protein